MAERVVIDASVGVALVRDEPISAQAAAAIRAWSATGIELVVPSHFWIEVLNVLVRKHRRSHPEVIEALATLDELAIATVEADRPLLLLGLVPMTQAGLSAYDALYLALAIAAEARLATLDRRLAEAAGDRAIVIGEDRSRDLRERPADYGSAPGREPAWLRSAVVGAYIAELRRRATLAEVR